LAKNGWQLIIKNINMKQLLFLLLFPCLALAQYPGNAGQKITLGEQTTADGLVYRGVANDTNVITPFSDTSAYIILDTVNSKFYHYNRTTTYWSLAGGGVSVTSFSAGSTGLTPSDATTGAVTLGGTLAVVNGGTGQTTLAAANIITGSGTTNFIPKFASANSINNSTISTDNEVASITNANTNVNTMSLPQLRLINNAAAIINQRIDLGFRFEDGTYNGIAGISMVRESATARSSRLVLAAINSSGDPNNAVNIKSGGYVGIGTDDPTEALHVVGNARITGLANAENPVNVQVDVNGVLVRTSSIDIKEDVKSLPYGLNEVMLLQPSKFSYIDKYKYGEGYDIGFIAEDVNNVIPEAVGTGVESDVFMDSVKLIPVLTKAIQEQQSLIKALEQRLLILENK
jgi:hypothetical protein